jgi:hypothetical protein
MPSLRPILAVLAVVAALAVAGCGSSSDGTGTERVEPPASSSAAPQRQAPAGARAKACGADGIRATGVSCGFARQIVEDWHEKGACAPAPGASRTSCGLGGLTCLGASTGRGLAVTCAAPGRSVAFVAKAP